MTSDADPRPAGAFPGTPTGTETILVVENEDAVRRLIRAILETNGYKVYDAGGAGEALELCAELDEPIDLLLTDIDMPDMNGRELAKRIRAARPNMTLLYTSGRDPADLFGFGVLPGGPLFLAKPFTPYGLAWRVREVLDAAAVSAAENNRHAAEPAVGGSCVPRGATTPVA